MKFKKSFRGYDPEQVERYLKENSEKESKMRAVQKERIDMLSDENFSLRKQLRQYQEDEKAISQSLIDSRHMAEEVKGNAEKYSELVLTRAKTFYAAWKAYSQTLISSLSDEEVIAFNSVLKKIENLINVYQGGDIESDPVVADAKTFASKGGDFEESVGDDEIIELDFSKNREELERERGASSAKVESALEGAVSLSELETAVTVADEAEESQSDSPKEPMQNPISKIEDAAEQTIDLRELLRPEQSLEDLCSDLGLIPPQKNGSNK